MSKQEILSQASIKKLNEESAALTQEKQNIIKKRDTTAKQAADLLDMTAPQYDSSYNSPWNLKSLVPHANEIIEERRPGPPQKRAAKQELANLEKSILDFTDNNKQATTIQNAIRGKIARNTLLDTYNTKTPAAITIQSAIRNRNARHELDKSLTARRTIQSTIRRRQLQQQFRAQQNIASQVGAQTKRILTNKAQIKRFETEISDLDKPAARASTTERRNERRPIVETGLNILRRNQIKQAEGRPRTRSGKVAENESMQSMASTIAKGPKKK